MTAQPLSRRAETAADGLDVRQCEWCGGNYEPYVRRASAQRFCSSRCKQAEWDSRHPRLPFPPATRRTDPSSSRQAEAGVTASGQRHTHAEIVAKAVLAHPGSTAHEIEACVELGYHETMRRLNDAAATGEIRRGEKRRCRVGGKKVLTWWPV